MDSRVFSTFASARHLGVTGGFLLYGGTRGNAIISDVEATHVCRVPGWVVWSIAFAFVANERSLRYCTVPR